MNLSIAERVQQKALEPVKSRARAKAREELCRDCLDRRCERGSACRAFELLSNSYAWEMVAASAELN